ncbi:MAG: hypothetical protein HYV36_00710 [Lentisphaerae bacterium]|nr:hypothetical protein [Lentisphaerota bacterium]
MKTALFWAVLLCVVQLTVSPVFGEDKPQAEKTPAAVEPAAAPVPPPPFLAGKQPMFQPVAMDPALVRQSMQARSEYDDLNRRVIARQTKLYEENAKIKELQSQLRELQKKIDQLLAEDEELTALKKKYEAITPEMPMGSRKGFGTNAPPSAPGAHRAPAEHGR